MVTYESIDPSDKMSPEERLAEIAFLACGHMVTTKLTLETK